MLTTRFLFPKFFPKKFGQKIGAGPPMEDFGTARARSGPCSTPPPFRADEKHPGGFFPPAFRQRSGGAPTVLVARISVCRRFAHISISTSRRITSLATFLPHLTLRDAIPRAGSSGKIF